MREACDLTLHPQPQRNRSYKLGLVVVALLAACASSPCRIGPKPPSVIALLHEYGRSVPELPPYSIAPLAADMQDEFVLRDDTLECDSRRVPDHKVEIMTDLILAARLRAHFAAADVCTLATWAWHGDGVFTNGLGDSLQTILADVQARGADERREFHRAMVAVEPEWTHQLEQTFGFVAGTAPESVRVVAPTSISTLGGGAMNVALRVQNQSDRSIRCGIGESYCGRSGSVWVEVIDRFGMPRRRRTCALEQADVAIQLGGHVHWIAPKGDLVLNIDLRDYIAPLEAGSYAVRFCVSLQGDHIDSPAMPFLVPVIWSSPATLLVN